MRQIFSEINKKLHFDIESIIQNHTLRCSYQSLKSLAVFGLKNSFQTGKWFGDRTTSHTQQWPDPDIFEATNPWELRDLRIKEIEYYAPSKYYIYGMRVTLSDGRQSPVLGDYYDLNPFLVKVQFPQDREIHSVLIDSCDSNIYRMQFLDA